MAEAQNYEVGATLAELNKVSSKIIYVYVNRARGTR
jgi:hypothetical protein